MSRGYVSMSSMEYFQIWGNHGFSTKSLNSNVEESSCCTVIADGSVGYATL